jgi:hypothetical protein
VEATLSGAGAGLDAAATEQQLVRPLLAALDWKVDKAAKGAQYDLALTAGGKTIAICNVVPADTKSLELTDDAQGAGSPDLRMIAALTEQHKNGVLWGILTNGTTWRLFGSFASSASGVYYEVDLPDLLAIGKTADLRFFAAFFGAVGLVPLEPQQPALIMRVYHDGQRSAQEVGKNLKDAIFAQVFVDLATGQALAALLPVDEQGQFRAFAEGASGAEEQSDVVHDLLAHLAQHMIDLNKQKQTETRRFLAWLEERLDIEHKGKTGIDALTGKTTLQHYLGDYQKGEEAQPWEAVLAVLSRNKGKFGVGKQVLEGAAAGTLRTEYERSLAVLRPIKAQLARTDALIDQVVYLLYGLTADEVAVVERKA